MNKMNKQEDFELENYEIDEENKKTEKYTKGIMAALVLLGVLMAVYIGGAVYFRDRFFFNTRVNGVDFSRQTTADARVFVESKADDFYIAILGENAQIEKIYASEVNLRFIASEAIEGLLATQNSFAWPLSLLNSQETYAEVAISFDDELFSERVSNLELVTEGQTSPVSANVIMDGTDVVIVPHQYGNIVNVELLKETLQDYIGMLADTFNTVKADIFVQPEFKTDSIEIIDAFETANRYLSTEITYLVGTEVLVDRTLISDWLTIDDVLNVHLDEEQISTWLGEFINSVNTGAPEFIGGVLQPVTNGATRTFTSPQGNEVTLSGGFYGWIVDRNLELAELLENIRAGDVIRREPIYFQRAVSHGSHDWGDTFLQVNLTEQHMWAIFDGEVVFDSPVVTGLPNGERNTPQGVYSILELLSPTELISPWLDDNGQPTYIIPVSYWMRTSWSGYGFHDMQQPRFGGTQYRISGSHGCTNMPLAAARQLYHMIYIGMPVVVHY